MQPTLLTQAYNLPNDKSVGAKLVELLADNRFHTFTALSAFSSRAGVAGLAAHLKAAQGHLKKVTIITGIDQKATSAETLHDLKDLSVNAFIFYQKEGVIFHPKIYLFEGDTHTTFIVGSSNLTANGLFGNVETSLALEIKNSVKADYAVITELKEYFAPLFAGSDPNLLTVTDEVIAEFVSAGIVPTETERKALYAQQDPKQVGGERDALRLKIPKRALAKIPGEFRRRKKVVAPEKATAPAPVLSVQPSRLLWQSGPLTERDLSIPTGSNTNLTGSMLFKKGLLQNIDQRHYFREVVFKDLQWTPDSSPKLAHLERAEATFHLIVNGVQEGSFVLRLSHNTKTDTPTYRQLNSMTSVSWGTARNVVGKVENIGKNAALYSIPNEKDAFLLLVG